MKFLLIVAALAGLTYLGLKAFASGAPQGRLSNVITVPGAAISRLNFSGGHPATLLIVVGGAVVVLIIVYALMSK
jgi:hypothetical protein